jgi:hypothetical protein
LNVGSRPHEEEREYCNVHREREICVMGRSIPFGVETHGYFGDQYYEHSISFRAVDDLDGQLQAA